MEIVTSSSVNGNDNANFLLQFLQEMSLNGG